MQILSSTPIKEILEKEIIDKLQVKKISFFLYSDKNCIDSQYYLNSIKKLLIKFNIEFVEGFYDDNLSQLENRELFKQSIKHNQVLLARPIKQINENDFISLIPQNQDPDMLTDFSRGALFRGDLNYLPATVASCDRIIKYYNINLINKNVTVIGRSISLGLPLFQYFQLSNSNVTLLHSKTSQENKREQIKRSDIVALATGVPNLINRSYFNNNQIIIDCGFKANSGDLGFVPSDNEFKAYTPVPKGIGGLTSLCLILNALHN